MKNVKKLQNESHVIFRDLSLKHGICRMSKKQQPIIVSDGKQYDLINIEITEIK